MLSCCCPSSWLRLSLTAACNHVAPHSCLSRDLTRCALRLSGARSHRASRSSTTQDHADRQCVFLYDGAACWLFESWYYSPLRCRRLPRVRPTLLDDLQMHLLTPLRVKSRVFTKGTLLRLCEFSFIYARYLVFGYTEYKGKQKEIFDAAINGVFIRNIST
jgi:hypothetical protein